MGDEFIEPLAETENYAVIRAVDEEGEVMYQLELPSITLYFIEEEWREFVALITGASEEG